MCQFFRGCKAADRGVVFGNAIKALNSGHAQAIRDEIEGLQAHLVAQQAWFTSLLGLPEQGLALAKESIATLRRLDDRDELFCLALNCLAINAVFLNRVDEIEDAGREMLELATENSDRWFEAMALAGDAELLLLSETGSDTGVFVGYIQSGGMGHGAGFHHRGAPSEAVPMRLLRRPP